MSVRARFARASFVLALTGGGGGPAHPCASPTHAARRTRAGAGGFARVSAPAMFDPHGDPALHEWPPPVARPAHRMRATEFALDAAPARRDPAAADLAQRLAALSRALEEAKRGDLAPLEAACAGEAGGAGVRLGARHHGKPAP